MIFLKERIESWREATTVNNVKRLKSPMLSLLVGKFCD